MDTRSIASPLDKATLASLRCGDLVEITGTIYTARDAAHMRFLETLDCGGVLPFNLSGQIIYYAGPSPAKPGAIIGSCGPTTAGRMDIATPRLLKEGLAATIGKGPRSAAVIDAMKETGAVYFAAIGGAAALTAQCITEVSIVAYEDLGPEAVRKLEVVSYPCVVAIDSYGVSLYEEGPKQYKGVASSGAAKKLQ